MADRLPSDHPAVETVRATIVRRGRTDRPAIELPADGPFPENEVVRLVVDGDEYHARIESTPLGDELLVQGAYDSPSFARERDGTDRLAEWYEQNDVGFGNSVLVDVVEPEFKYGVRTPGTRTVYSATEAPDDSLASIAERLDED